MHVDLVARKKQIEREKGRENVKFPFKKERGEGNKEEMRQRKINLLELNFFPKFSLWLKNGKKKKGKNQYFSLFSFPLFSHKKDLGEKFISNRLIFPFPQSHFPFISLPSPLFKGEFHILPFLLSFYPFFSSHKIHMHEKIMTTHELKGKRKNQSAGAHLSNKVKL